MKTVITVFLLMLFCLQVSVTCTTAVVSGKASADGRPLLLKNRDADALQNRLVSILDTKYHFVGLVNSSDKKNEEVWSGFNNAGFAIMNSASYNLKGDDTSKLADLEGKVMKSALAVCATLADFEQLLRDAPKPLGVEANFGVIDAQGGAAYYEVNNYHFTKYDVNDPAVAPNGYLIRTNYSCGGEENAGYGYIRFSTATELFSEEFAKRKLTAAFLIRDVPRCLVHSMTKTDLGRTLPKDLNDTTFVFFRDYIPRYSTSTAIVVQGVKPDESRSLMTMWTVLGFPLTSVTVPVWLLQTGLLPKIMTADTSGNAPLCTAALKLKEKVFPKQNDAKENYINVAALMNKEKTGVRQKLNGIEEKILKKADQHMASWRKGALNEQEAEQFYAWIDAHLIHDMRKATGEKK